MWAVTIPQSPIDVGVTAGLEEGGADGGDDVADVVVGNVWTGGETQSAAEDSLGSAVDICRGVGI